MVKRVVILVEGVVFRVDRAVFLVEGVVGAVQGAVHRRKMWHQHRV